MRKTISVVIPVYNEEKNVPLLYERISNVFAQLPNYDYEIIFVNDGSSDTSLSAINHAAQASPKVRVLDFSRNFGKESALTAGIHNAKGDAVITIDSDLQQPPELIPEFVRKWEEGEEVVIGVRKKVERASLFRRV